LQRSTQGCIFTYFSMRGNTTKQVERLQIRKCRVGDLPALINIWHNVGLTIGLSDTIPEMRRLLRRNPETCLVGFVDSKVVGGVMGGFDGRRGLVHHLAVDPDWQGRGFGRALMSELEKRFQQRQVVKMSFWVEARNQPIIDFYRHLGYELRDLITMSKTLR